MRGPFFPYVRYSSREEFVSGVRELRLRELECYERMQAVRCGMASVIPLELLSLLTAHDLDLRVCGLPHINLEYLKVHVHFISRPIFTNVIHCTCTCILTATFLSMYSM